MGRLRLEFLDRVEKFSHSMLDVVAALDEHGVSRRIVDQVAAAGTSVGANVFEADEGMSRADFIKCLAIASKEVSESRYWLRLIIAREWASVTLAAPLLIEGLALQKILGTMIKNSRKASPYRAPPSE